MEGAWSQGGAMSWSRDGKQSRHRRMNEESRVVALRFRGRAIFPEKCPVHKFASSTKDERTPSLQTVSDDPRPSGHRLQAGQCPNQLRRERRLREAAQRRASTLRHRHHRQVSEAQQQTRSSRYRGKILHNLCLQISESPVEREAHQPAAGPPVRD